MNCAVQVSGSKPGIDAETLAKRWNISLQAAKNTIQVTTQKGIRNAQHPVNRRFNTSQPQLRYKQLAGKWYSDTAFFTVRGLAQETCAQVTTNGKGYTRFYPLTSKSKAGEGLLEFIQFAGIPEHLITDCAPEESKPDTNWTKVVKTYHIKQTWTESYSPWQDKSEQEIRELKRAIKKMIHYPLWAALCL